MTDTFHTLLDFYTSAGVNTALEDVPQDRFKETLQQTAQSVVPAHQKQEPTPPIKAQIKRPSPAPATPISTPAIKVPETGRAVEDAQTIASSCNTLEELRNAFEKFDACSLQRTAKNLAFSDGNADGRVMIIGEAPGRDEDIAGKPFVGRSGQLLDKILTAIDLTRERDVYIANTVPWRPPGNRAPTEQETLMCRPFINRQIELANPDIIVLTGGSSAKSIWNEKAGILSLRGKWRTLEITDKKIPSIATLHPAYLLRQPAQKRLIWQDFLKIADHLNQ